MKGIKSLFYINVIYIRENCSESPIDFLNVCSDNFVFEVTDKQYQEMQKTSKLRYSKFQSSSTIICMLTFEAAVAKLKNINNAGVITLSGPHSLDVANKYSEVIVTKGERFVNPIQFPYTLHNAVACELAAYQNMQSIAMSTGQDKFAFLDAIKLASNLLISGMLQEIIISCGGFIQPYFIKNIKRNAISVSAKLSLSDSKGSIGIVALPFARNDMDIYDLKKKYSISEDNYYEYRNDSNKIINKMPLVWVIEFLHGLKYFNGNGLSMIMVKKDKTWEGMVINISH